MRHAVSAVLAISVTGCSLNKYSPVKIVSHMFGPSPGALIGTVSADEPQATLVGRDILQRGGNAADAATAMGMALSVTLPSRASLGAGGACLAYRPGDQNGGRAFMFLPVAGTVAATGMPRADRPAAVPMMARGLYLMHLQYGSVAFSELLPGAITLASNGINVSRQLAGDLAAVQVPLLADAGIRAIFSRSDGKALAEGDALVQTHLSGALDQIRSMGVGDLYNGALAQSFVAGSQAAGGGLQVADLRAAVPSEQKPLVVENGETRVAFLPPPADGGLGSAVTFRSAASSDAATRAQAAIAAWRAQNGNATGGTVDSVLARAQAFVNAGGGAGGGLPALPASTSFTVVDHAGMAVACSLSMDNLFGTGRMAGNTGIVLGASPARLPQPLYTAAIASQGRAFRAVAAGSGQNDAAAAVGVTMRNILAGQAPDAHPVTAQGRVNAISCPRGLPGDGATCVAATDPRGAGLAMGPR
ncbi:gamma-glutamyltransferase [Komagataeibacter rhaeticus]|uniref:gamma-glutamyltransferase n=1 Tax=Komagataeibacter rhaeticus TaxID=215221 RepID=UPI0039EB5467